MIFFLQFNREFDKTHTHTYFKQSYFIGHLRYTISGRKPITRLECFTGSQRSVRRKEVVLIIQYSSELIQTNFAELPNVWATLA